MTVTKEIKKASEETLNAFKSFNYEQYEKTANDEDSKEEMREFFHRVSINDSETIELSKQIRIK